MHFVLPTVTGGLLVSHVLAACSLDPNVTTGPAPGPIPDSQTINAPSFIGTAATPRELDPKFVWQPNAFLMHQDGGNSGSTDFPGPLGSNLNISSAMQTVQLLLWGTNGTLTGSFADLTTSPPAVGIAALDPATFQVIRTWFPPDGQNLNIGYMELIPQNGYDLVVLSSAQGRIFVLRRFGCGANATIELARDIDVSENIPGNEKSLLNAMLDSAGNIWFTTGVTPGSSPSQQPNSTTIGYVAPDNAVHVLNFPDQMVENGIAVSNTTMFVVTGPSWNTTQTNATGYLATYTPASGEDGGVQEVWRIPYSAGSGIKPGGFSRGSGTTPSLLGDQFVVATDNHDGQVNLLVAHQSAQPTSPQQVACMVPLFTSGKVATDIGANVHFDGRTYGVVLVNNYDGPPLVRLPGDGTDINGAFNNLSAMPGGITRVDVSADGGSCAVRWTSNVTTTTVPILSTDVGLYYAYIQDQDLAARGEYAWYTAALDWDEGNIIWQAKVGAGGIFNNNWAPASLGPDGTFYQSVIGGIATVRDN